MELTIQDGGGAEEQIHVSGNEALIGRAEDCDVIVDRPYVSKYHAKVINGQIIVDLESSNGTFVGDRRIEGAQPLDGGWVTLGRGDIKIRATQGAATNVPPLADPSGLEVERLQSVVAELEEKLAAARNAPPEESEQQRKFQRENIRLRRALVELRDSMVREVPEGSSATKKLLFKLQRDNVLLRDEVLRLRELTEEAAAGGESDHAGGGSFDLAEFARLLEPNFEDVEAGTDQEISEFLLVESFRFVRRVERVVSRLSGGMIQLLRMDTTMVPGSSGNTRELIKPLISGDDSEEARRALVQYYLEIGRWFVAILGGQRKAGEELPLKMCKELSEESLLAGVALGRMQRKDTELWKRACAYLSEQTPEAINDRFQRLTRAAAVELLGTDE